MESTSGDPSPATRNTCRKMIAACCLFSITFRLRL
jgi:hypothetical protein